MHWVASALVVDGRLFGCCEIIGRIGSGGCIRQADKPIAAGTNYTHSYSFCSKRTESNTLKGATMVLC